MAHRTYLLVLVLVPLVLGGCPDSGETGTKGQDTVLPDISWDVAYADGAFALDGIAGPDATDLVDEADVCAGVICTDPCASDDDCVEHKTCVPTQGGCCAVCVPRACDTTDDCPGCSVCSGPGGNCVPIPCVTECTIDEDCAPGEVCETTDGCCGTCKPGVSCADYQCALTCATDADCPMGAECLVHSQGCCSECAPFCELCSLTAGTYCPDGGETCTHGTLTVEEIGTCWFELAYSGEAGVDTLIMDGCSDHTITFEDNGCSATFTHGTGDLGVACDWCGVIPYTTDACPCIPSCDGKECGDDGCGGSCGGCAAGCSCEAGQCVGCLDTEVALEPWCIHAPALVGAGGQFPLVVYGPLGCAEYDHAEITQVGTQVDVELVGLTYSDGSCPMAEACTGEDWTFFGVVWIDAPNPGAYHVAVGTTHEVIVGASGGIIDEPACLDDCPTPSLDGSSFTLVTPPAEPVTAQCGLGAGDGTVSFSGGCQDYTVGGSSWSFDAEATYCTDGWLYLGSGLPVTADAHVCDVGGSLVLLGTDLGQSLDATSPGIFLLK